MKELLKNKIVKLVCEILEKY